MVDALTSLYSELAKPLIRYAMIFIKEPALAEDIVAETFLKATRHCIAHNELPNRSWFYKVTRNMALDLIKKGRRMAYEAVPEMVDDTREANPEIAAVYSEQMATLAVSLAQLPEPYRSVLLLKEYDNLTYAEISSIIGVSMSNVKVLLFRARQKLKERYRRDYKDEM